jgi:hypothetical protein
MALTVIHKAPEGEALAAACIGDSVCLLNPRRRARRHVRLYRDAEGRPFVNDRLYGRRYLKAIAFTCIDGKPLNCGAAVLEEESR